MVPPSPFLSLFSARAPALLFREDVDPESEAIRHGLRNQLHGPPDQRGADLLTQLAAHPALESMRSFFSAHDGASLCLSDPGHTESTLFTLAPVLDWRRLSSRIEPGGDLAWVVELNTNRRVRSLYRAEHQPLVFATFGEPPDCLATFVAGPDAGRVYFLTPEPSFNIGKPLSPDFARLCRAIGADLAAFLRRCGVTSPAGIRPWKYVADEASASTAD